jgi:glycerol-3-phosphate acyltransferase PlsX
LSDALLIALDAMGGDYAPQEIVRGAIRFVLSDHPDATGVEVALVGDPEAISTCLKAEGFEASSRLSLISATEVIAMDEHPLEAIKKKPDSSIGVCAKLVKEGRAQATLSAGNTGACLVAGVMLIGRLPQISRPPIATYIPRQGGGATLIVDAGANVDCQPSHLADFALLGSLYMQEVAGIARPRVALLSNGEEDAKGDELVKRSRSLLQELGLNFTGNIEGNTLFEDHADVVVCDGFAGNVLLKTAEGMAGLCLSLLEDVPEVQRRVRERVDWAECGGAPLLGIDGVSVIAHGRSNARAIETALQITARAARSGYVEAARTALEGRSA